MTSDLQITPELNFWSALLIICAGQSLFFSVIFFTHKKGNRIANKFLALLIFFFTLYFVFIAAFWSKYLIVFPNLIQTTAVVNYLWGPLFYLYTSELLEKNKSFNYKKLLHFIPAVVSTIYYSRFYFIEYEKKVNYAKLMVNDETYSGSLTTLLLGAVVIVHIFIYTFFAVKKIIGYSDKNKSAVNTLDFVNYKWLQKLSFGFVGFFFSWFVYEILMYSGIKYYVEVDYLITFFGVVVVYTTAIISLRQPEIISGASEIKGEPKYERTVISKEEAENYLSQLNSLMNDEKLFLNSELNIRMLAETLGISHHKLSQLINEFIKMNFSDYLNKFRIEEAKQRLVNPKYASMTVLSIAYDVGFNSKASFNNAFKKITGQTPTEFRTSESVSIAEKN